MSVNVCSNLIQTCKSYEWDRIQEYDVLLLHAHTLMPRYLSFNILVNNIHSKSPIQTMIYTVAHNKIIDGVVS